MAHLLNGENLSLSFPTRTILEGVTVGINGGDRIGIVGRNGDGKSTLMKILASRLTPDTGRVTYRSGIRVGLLDQTDALEPSLTVAQAVVGDRDEHEWAGDPKVRDVINGLVSDVDWNATVGELSGGQQRRTALAALLTQEWDVLFLDEPTNHLDVEGIAWLAQHINKRWPKNHGGLLVVTHDRWFLDEVCTTTWEVHDGAVEPFEGGYAAYVLQRVERDRIRAVTEQKRQNLMKKELAWLRRGAPARTSKPKFRIDAANELIADVPPPRDSVNLSRMAVSRLGKRVVDLEDVSVSYQGNTGHVLDHVTWRVAPGERTGIVGGNGAGKTTLLRLITGALKPSQGRVAHGKTVKIAVLTQQLHELEEVADQRVSDVIGRKKASYVADGKELTPGQLLERLGFTNAQLSTPVRELSGGQKRRLQLLMILLDEPNVLVLDEPTNDLDTDVLAAMEDLLDTWPGTLIVVSHDRYLLERVTDQQYALIGGTLRHLPGGVDEYVRLRSSAASHQKSSNTDNPPKNAAKLSGAAQHAIRKEMGSIERRIEKIDSQVTTTHQRMSEHDPHDYEGLNNINADIQKLEKEKEILEERWLTLSETIDMRE